MQYRSFPSADDAVDQASSSELAQIIDVGVPLLLLIAWTQAVKILPHGWDVVTLSAIGAWVFFAWCRRPSRSVFAFGEFRDPAAVLGFLMMLLAGVVLMSHALAQGANTTP